ncbi:MAG: carboxypeptidase regulatory-like domain-containing protein, partial [Catalinimonas sp.]
MRLLSLMIGLLCLTAPARAATLTGRILDADDGQPLAFATVALHRSADSTLVDGTLSGDDGSFRLDDVPPGDYYLRARFMGYAPRLRGNLRVGSADVTLTDIALRAGEQLLEEVRVRGERVTQYHTVDRQVYDARQFRDSRGGTAADVLRNVPSVAVDGQGEITVRGGSGFQVILNGQPVQGDAAALLRQLPANAVERVELVTAPSAKYDPDGKAGLIVIETRPGSADGLSVQTNVLLGLPPA